MHFLPIIIRVVTFYDKYIFTIKKSSNTVNTSLQSPREQIRMIYLMNHL